MLILGVISMRVRVRTFGDQLCTCIFITYMYIQVSGLLSRQEVAKEPVLLSQNEYAGKRTDVDCLWWHSNLQLPSGRLPLDVATGTGCTHASICSYVICILLGWNSGKCFAIAFYHFNGWMLLHTDVRSIGGCCDCVRVTMMNDCE